MRPRSNTDSHDEAETNVLFELWRLACAANVLLVVELTAMGMSGDEFGIYSVLGTNEQGLTPTVLAEWMSAPATTVSSHLKRLEARGHVARRPDPADGRGSLRLTAAGRRALRQATAIYTPVLDGVRRQLGQDEATVLGALVTLRQAIDASQAEAPPTRPRRA